MRERICLFAAALGWLVGCGQGATNAPQPPPAAEPPKAARSVSATPVAAPAAAPSTTPEPSAQPTDVEKALAYDPADPLGDLESADALDRMGQGNARAVTPPKGGCAVQDAGRRVWPAPGPVTIDALPRGFVVAGYALREGRDQVYVVRVGDDGKPEPVTAFDIDPPHTQKRVAPPGLGARDDSAVLLAVVDGAGKLSARTLHMGPGGGGAKVELASSVDTRFAPAVAYSETRALIAYTAASTPMRAKLVVLSNMGSVVGNHDVTPESMGAAAATFVDGASPPTLLAVDAREGLSPLLRIDLGSDGTPKPAQIVLPLSTVSTPPRLSGASASIGAHVLYSGMGSAATTAVGLVSIEPIVGRPSAFVPGTGYGALNVATAAAPAAVVLVAEAPTATTKDAPREIHVALITRKGQSKDLVLSAPGGAAHTSVARDAHGMVAVAWSSPSGIYVARLRCDDE
jgi:hypothetical protein